MSHKAMILLLTCAVGCAAKPTPPPAPPEAKSDEVPIRSDADIAHDQSQGAPIVDPAVCATRPNTLGCPANRGSKPGPFDNKVNRNPRLLQTR